MQGALSSASLMEPEGRNWIVLLQDMSRFRAGFFSVYRAHHQGVHGELPLYARDLESARRKVAALGLLNSLAELGEPAGADLDQSLADLDVAFMPCTVPGSDLNLESLLERADRNVPDALLETMIDAAPDYTPGQQRARAALERMLEARDKC